ncbi:uncharacterized protein LOC142229554 [Haematobia irritans]|uniref:uncharacterized protein LOC142229554 n=1 Tax=Haematobia irritans TaxID=7368 RepID=UPI003F503D21
METAFMEDIRQRDMKIKKHFNDLEQLLEATMDLISKKNFLNNSSIASLHTLEMQMKLSLLEIGTDSIIFILNEAYKKLIEFDIKVLELKSNPKGSSERDVLKVLTMRHHYKNFLDCKMDDVLSFARRVGMSLQCEEGNFTTAHATWVNYFHVKV